MLQSACSDQKSTNSCLFCVPRGTIIASSQIRRRGYVSGEVISLSTDVHNMSNATVLNTTAAIIQVSIHVFIYLSIQFQSLEKVLINHT